MLRNIPIDELHMFLDGEIKKAITQIQSKVSDDSLSVDANIRLATEISVLQRVKAKYYKEES